MCRPYNQGARLTAFELVYEQIPATLICDSMAAAAMRQLGVQAVVVGADRVAANGDTANKIGTYQLAVLAKHHGQPETKSLCEMFSMLKDLLLKFGRQVCRSTSRHRSRRSTLDWHRGRRSPSNRYSTTSSTNLTTNPLSHFKIIT